MVGVLSSDSPQEVVVPLILVSRWSFYFSVQTCVLGHAKPLPRESLLYPITSFLGFMLLDIAVMDDSDSILDCQKLSKKLALLLLYIWGDWTGGCLAEVGPREEGWFCSCLRTSG